MSKKTMNVAKTLGIGLVAGTAAMTVGSVMMRKKNNNGTKQIKKTAGKAVHTMGQMLNSVESMLK